MFKNKMLVIAGLLGALALGMSGCAKEKPYREKSSHKRHHRMHKKHARKSHARNARKHDMRNREHEEKNLFRK